MAIRADILFQKFFHALHALLILDFGKRVFDGVNGVKIGKIQISGLTGILIVIENVLFLRRTVEYDVLFLLGQIPERDICPHAHFTADVRHERPHQAVPRRDSALVDSQRVIGNQRRHIYGVYHSRSATFCARALRIERQLLGGRRVKMRAAFRADQFLSGCDKQRRLQIVSVRAAVACKAGIHQTQAVEQLCSRAERAADTRHTGALMQRQRGGDIQHLIYAGFGRLRHSAAGVGRQRFEIPARAFRVQYAQCQRGFAGAGHTRNSHNFTQRNIYINVFKVVDFCATNQHFINHTWPHRLFLVSSESLRAAVLQLNPFYGSR